MSKLIKDLPKWVQEIVIERRIEHGEQPDYEIYPFEAFLFVDSQEGLNIWQDVCDGNYQPLADFHGITIDEQGEKVGEVDLIKSEKDYLDFTNKLFHQTTPTAKDPVDGYGGC